MTRSGWVVIDSQFHLDFVSPGFRPRFANDFLRVESKSGRERARGYIPRLASPETEATSRGCCILRGEEEQKEKEEPQAEQASDECMVDSRKGGRTQTSGVVSAHITTQHLHRQDSVEKKHGGVFRAFSWIYL